MTSRLSQSLARGALALAVLGPVAWPAQDAPLSAPAGDAFALEVVPFIARYCSECHADPDGDPGLVLTKVTRGADARAAAETWEDVLAVLDLYDMPPRGARQPNAHERAQIVRVLEDILALDPAPEYPGLRRLNAAEYTRTVRDLLGVEFDARAHFPPDGIGHGFDTVAAGLTLSDLAVELYLSTAETLAAEAVAVDHSASPGRTRLAGKQLSGAGRSGAKVLNTNGAIMGTFEVPRAGRYRLGSAAAATQAGTELARMGFSVDGRHLGEFDVQATPARARAGHPEEHFVECQLEAGSHRVGAHFLNDYYVPDHPDPTRRDRNLYVLWIELEGPLDAPPLTPFQLALAQRVGPDGLPESEAGRLAHLVHRIWRRPARAEDIERLLALPGPEAAADERLRIQLTALLASPHFIFRLEPAPSGAESGELRALGGSELASRLSYFLWGTTPDEELQLAASRGSSPRPSAIVVGSRACWTIRARWPSPNPFPPSGCSWAGCRSRSRPGRAPGRRDRARGTPRCVRSWPPRAWLFSMRCCGKDSACGSCWRRIGPRPMGPWESCTVSKVWRAADCDGCPWPPPSAAVCWDRRPY